MTAKEMFEKLRYKREENEKDIIYILDALTFGIRLEFSKETNALFVTPSHNHPVIFYTQDIKAIQKQIEELGWEE